MTIKLLPSSKIYVAGHLGMVGSAVLSELKRQGFTNIVTKCRQELDLTRQNDVEAFFSEEEIEFVIIAAAKVGGILANSELPADFIYQNLMIESNLINSAYLNHVSQLIFLGSSCIYPKHASQPIGASSAPPPPVRPCSAATLSRRSRTSAAPLPGSRSFV